MSKGQGMTLNKRAANQYASQTELLNSLDSQNY
jgi:hypothetical protein